MVAVCGCGRTKVASGLGAVFSLRYVMTVFRGGLGYRKRALEGIMMGGILAMISFALIKVVSTSIDMRVIEEPSRSIHSARSRPSYLSVLVAFFTIS